MTGCRASFRQVTCIATYLRGNVQPEHTTVGGERHVVPLELTGNSHAGVRRAHDGRLLWPSTGTSVRRRTARRRDGQKAEQACRRDNGVKNPRLAFHSNRLPSRDALAPRESPSRDRVRNGRVRGVQSRSGAVVSRTWESISASRAGTASSRPALGPVSAPRSRTSWRLPNRTDIISFSGGVPDPLTFPGVPLVEVLDEIVASQDSTAFQYAPTPGYRASATTSKERIEALHGRRPARRRAAGHERRHRGDRAPGDSPFSTRATPLSWRRRRTWARSMGFVGLEARVVGVSLDGDGLDVDALRRELEAGLRPKLVYTIPDYQNPTGAHAHRGAAAGLVELARRFQFLIVEDVAYRELTFERGTSRRASGRSHRDVVLQISTFSKTFCPGVRLGWAVGPAEVVSELVRVKQNTDQCAAALWPATRRGVRPARASRRADRALTRAVRPPVPPDDGGPQASDCRPWYGWTRPRGGFFTWLTLGESVDSIELAQARHAGTGVAVVPGVPFFADGRGARRDPHLLQPRDRRGDRRRVRSPGPPACVARPVSDACLGTARRRGARARPGSGRRTR